VDQTELQAFRKLAKRHPLWIPGDDAVRVSIGREGIGRLIPHRDPFLLLDEISDVALTAQAIRGGRRIDPRDEVFLGHFPDRPLYPGVLQLEMIGQLGLCLLRLLAAHSTEITPDMTPRDARALKVHTAQFCAPIGPGDQLTLGCRALEVNDYTAICAGQVMRGDTICSFGVMEVYFVDG
jgi:3-hydroxyacyl-[acyl-carrier-protein] dehydratase